MYQKRDNELSILTLYLGGYDKQFYLREISRLTKIPLRTTQNRIANLLKEKVLKSIGIGKNKYFKLNLDNINTKFYLLHAEIYRTLQFIENYPLFKIFLKSISSNSLIIVFGSFAKFMADEDSDLDLLVISNEKIKIPIHLLPFKTHIIKLKWKSFEKAIKKQETLIKEMEDNHILLNNHSFYVDAMWNNYGR